MKEQIYTDEWLNDSKKKKISDVGLPELSYKEYPTANPIPRITPEELNYITHDVRSKSNPKSDASYVHHGVQIITNQQLNSSTYVFKMNSDRRRKSKSNAEKELQKERKVQRK